MSPPRLARPRTRDLSVGWSIRRTRPGKSDHPDLVDWNGPLGRWDVDDARVPCTMASALRDVGSLDVENDDGLAALGNLDRSDFWMRTHFAGTDEPSQIVFEGLATLASVWLNGEQIHQSSNMFVPKRIDLEHRPGIANELAILFHGLDDFLGQKRARARWRTQLVNERQLRFLRTTLFGRMPSWCPPIAPVGPWRAIRLETRQPDGLTLERVCVDPSLDGDRGRLSVTVQLTACDAISDGRRYWLEVEGSRHPLTPELDADGHVILTGSAQIEDVELWWPHTHLAVGTKPRLYSLALVETTDGQDSRIELEPVGFREIERAEGRRFALDVNGVRVFCRGTCWTPVDPLALQTDEGSLRAVLEQACRAGVNMLRLPGSGVYEQEGFYRICDELGLMVWQDFMFATLDYPTEDESFLTSIREEVDAFLNRVRGRACIAVLCGSGEREQQPAMLGLASEDRVSEFFDDWLPTRCAALRPDVPWWPSTPSGGELPFHIREGTAHYFGVGAYRRPLEALQSDRPSFATECLAFSNPAGVTGAEPTPEIRIPRDRGADWNFLDVTRHYARELFPNADAPDPATRTSLLRATVASLMERAQGHLRDPEADCGGALVLNHRDPWQSAGWGVFDSTGQPKSGWYGLARAWAPVAVRLFDDGLNGLRVSITNDRPSPLETRLEVALLRLDGLVIDSAQRMVRIEAHSMFARSLDSILGGFQDSSQAYRFGPPAFDLALARISGAEQPDGIGLEAVHLPPNQGLLARTNLGLEVHGESQEEEDPVLVLSTDSFAQVVTIEAQGALPSDNWFSLAPGYARRIRLARTHDEMPGPARIRALNSDRVVGVSAPQSAESFK